VHAYLAPLLTRLFVGYGLTETCGMTAITRPESWLPGSVGVLGPSTECKLQGKRRRGRCC
jgi:long-chain acyl-CoA synthetase